uniref:Major facilitator superfamily (MFS) profile domain-containing protein n=1 Tax=Romanomermis culicivorax TaxID=13658 RepID=A0A915KZM7_ROMCU
MSMLVNNILTLIAGLTMMATRVSGTYVTLLVGRLLIGVNCGLNSGLAPMYLTEISPINYRGLLGSVNQLMVTISILVANIVGMEFFLGRDCCWTYVLGFTILPAVWQVVALPMCPESPKYLLIMKGDGDQARRALKKLRQSDNVDAEMNAMQEEANKMKSAPAVTLGEMFKTPVLRWAMTLAIMLMLSQQLSGINATMFYSSSIFEKDAKLGPALATYATIGVMVVNVLMTVVSTAIVDKCGRRVLLLISLAGMFVTTICLVVTLYLSGQQNAMAPYFSILFVVLFVVAFATGKFFG